VGYPSPSQVSDVFAQFPFMDGIYQWSAWPFFYGDLQTVSNQADVNYLYAHCCEMIPSPVLLV